MVACVRHADQRPRVDPLTGAVHVDPLAASMSAADAAALEHALRLAETWPGRALAITAGPPAADETLRLAAAAGAAVLRVPWPPGEYVQELAGGEQELARALAAAIRTVGEPDVVICGDRSPDRGTGAVPAYLAHELAAAQATGLVAVASAGGTLTGERRLPAGRRERLRIHRRTAASGRPPGAAADSVPGGVLSGSGRGQTPPCLAARDPGRTPGARAGG
jgi:electron transfer flavoprotein beta subunit